MSSSIAIHTRIWGFGLLVAIVITTGLGFYSIYYKRGLKKGLDEEEILKWKESLEAAQVFRT